MTQRVLGQGQMVGAGVANYSVFGLVIKNLKKRDESKANDKWLCEIHKLCRSGDTCHAAVRLAFVKRKDLGRVD